MSFIERLDELLKEKGVNKMTFLQDLSYSKNAYSEWKSGVTKSYMNKIDVIADYFDTSVDYLLGRSDERNLITKHAASTVDDTQYDDLPEEAIQEMETFRQFLKEKYKKK